ERIEVEVSRPEEDEPVLDGRRGLDAPRWKDRRTQRMKRPARLSAVYIERNHLAVEASREDRVAIARGRGAHPAGRGVAPDDVTALRIERVDFAVAAADIDA